MKRRKPRSINSLEYRLEYAMIQKDLRNCDICEQAKLLGFNLTSSTISQYLSGKYAPKQDKIVLLSRILGVPELWLMGIIPLDDIEDKNCKNCNNPQETELLLKFRPLNNKGKEFILRLLPVMQNLPEFQL